MKLVYLKPALKCDSFDVAIGIKIPFFRVLVTIEPGRSLLQFVTTNCLIVGDLIPDTHISRKFQDCLDMNVVSLKKMENSKNNSRFSKDTIE